MYGSYVLFRYTLWPATDSEFPVYEQYIRTTSSGFHSVGSIATASEGSSRETRQQWLERCSSGYASCPFHNWCGQQAVCDHVPIPECASNDRFGTNTSHSWPADIFASTSPPRQCATEAASATSSAAYSCRSTACAARPRSFHAANEGTFKHPTPSGNQRPSYTYDVPSSSP